MSEPLLSPGMVVGETWEIIEPIGRGGMGEVWLASHRRVEGKQAAIKVLRRTTDGMPDQVARFRREAEIAARLEHPNIVQLFDFSSLPSGAPYLVMELLRGESLGKRLERGPLPLAELQELVVAIGAALHVAHAAGVVHRDLKPENIFLVSTSTGLTVKVLDFGISKVVDSDTVMTSDSIVLGTPQYMSPEQAMAEHQTITGQSDLFSLGTICFEALTGHRPFAANTLARTVYLVAMEPSPSLRTFAPELPDQVIAAVDRALAKLPEDRTPDIATFVKEFCGMSIAGTRAPVPPKLEPRAPRDPHAVTISGPGRARRPAARAWPFVAGAAAIAVTVMMVLATAAPAERVEPPRPVSDAPTGVVVAPNVPEPGGRDRVEPAPAPAPGPPERVVPPDAGVPLRVVSKTQPLSPEQQELLDSARAAAANAQWNQVVDWTLKPAIAERNDAISLRVLAWCHLGNLSMVTAYKARVVPAERAVAARACHAQGIEF
jgi:eukaryotic-like serine/threonine-protein kinase